MTINYSSKVVNCKGLGSMWKLALRWKGSVYKLIWPDMLMYTLVFFVLSAIYRFCLPESGKRTFELVSINLGTFTDKIPIAFVLGFYVSIVIQRWWAQFENIAWPDNLCVYVTSMVLGNDEGGRLIRRQILRFVNLGAAMALTIVSPTVKEKYSTTTHFVEAGFLSRNEKKIIDALSSKTTHPIYWLPFSWAACLVMKARREGRIRDDMAVKTLIDEINRLRGVCGMLLCYEWISIPLVYTQIVTIAVWSYFISTLMGRQFLDPAQGIDGQGLDYIVPIFTYIEFMVYVGWLKVAETLVNPFGDDDDDFEIIFVIERNLQISYMMVDEMYGTTPVLTRDIHWDDVFATKMKSALNSDYRPEMQHLFNNHMSPDYFPASHESDDRYPIVRSYSICGKKNCGLNDYDNSNVAIPYKALPALPGHGYTTWPSSKDSHHRAKLLNSNNQESGRMNPEKPMEEQIAGPEKEMELFDSHNGNETLLPPTETYSNFKI